MSDSNERTQPGRDTGRPRIVVGMEDVPSAEVALRWAEVEGRSVVPRCTRRWPQGMPLAYYPLGWPTLVGRHPGLARGRGQAPRRHRRADRRASRGRGPARAHRLGRRGAPRGRPSGRAAGRGHPWPPRRGALARLGQRPGRSPRPLPGCGDPRDTCALPRGCAGGRGRRRLARFPRCGGMGARGGPLPSGCRSARGARVGAVRPAPRRARPLRSPLQRGVRPRVPGRAGREGRGAPRRRPRSSSSPNATSPPPGWCAPPMPPGRPCSSSGLAAWAASRASCSARSATRCCSPALVLSSSSTTSRRERPVRTRRTRDRDRPPPTRTR